VAKKNRNQPVELRVEIDGLDVTGVPNKRSAAIDKLLELRGKGTTAVQ
jgi:hypothetical protein